MKFYPQDWQQDPALRSCGLAARGLWMELICIAHDAEPYGHVTLNGRPATTGQIARIVGITERDAAKLLKELEYAGVFSRKDDTTIYSRRMVRDSLARDQGMANGRMGGNPKLKRGDNPPPQPPDAKTLMTQEAEARDKKEKEGTPLPPKLHAGNISAELVPDSETGEPTFNGWRIARVFEKATDLARIDPAKNPSVTWDPLMRWFRDEIDPDRIYAAIRRCAQRANYRPPTTLAWFDRAVREQPKTH